MRYGLLAGILALVMLVLPAAAMAEAPSLGTPDVTITGDTIEEAEATVTVSITGDGITEVILQVQLCGGGMCMMPVDVPMVSEGDGNYVGTYSDFEAGNDYYQYRIEATNDADETGQTDYVHFKGLPGYEGEDHEDDDSEDDDADDDGNDTGKGENDTDSDDSPGFSLILVVGVMAVVVLLGRRTRKD